MYNPQINKLGVKQKTSVREKKAQFQRTRNMKEKKFQPKELSYIVREKREKRETKEKNINIKHR